jgi:type III secretory pathway component EscT
LKIHNVREKSSTHSTWRDFCWAVFLAGGFFFVIGFVYGVLSGVAVPLQDPTPAERALEKFHLQISQWLVVAGACLSVGGFFIILGKEIIRQLFRD